MCGRKGELKLRSSAKTHAFQVGAEKKTKLNIAAFYIF